MFNKIRIRIWQLRHNEVALNSAWQFFERFVGLGCSFIASIFVIRYFAPAEYGIFAYAASYVTLFSSLTSMGLQSIVVREVVKDSIPTETILGSAFVIMICGAVAALILAVSGALLTHEKNTATWIILIMCLTNIIGSLAVINYYFQAKIKARYIAYIMLVQDVIDICIRIGMVHFKAKLLSFALLGLIESILVYTAIYLLFKSSSKLKSWKIDIKTIKFLLHQSIPIALTALISSQYMRLDQVMLEHFKGFAQVAPYSVGIKLIEVFYIIPSIISINLLPKMTELFNNVDKTLFNRYFQKAVIINLASSIIIITLLFIFAERIVFLLYGAKYYNAVFVLKYGSLCILPYFLAVITEIWIQINSMQKYSLYKTIAMLVLNITLCIILIPRHGQQGAVAALVITYLISNLIVWIIFKDLRQLIFMKHNKIWRDL